MSLPQPPTPSTPSCPRHPNREAWRSCTRCGRPACNECLVQASVGSQCIECASASRPSAAVRAKTWNAGQPTLVTLVLMAINIAVFVLIGIRDGSGLSGDITADHVNLGLNKYQLADDHHWYRLLTSGFIHFGVFHILMNMLLLYQLGQLLERSLGRLRFGLLYVACLLGGSLGVLAIQSNNFGLTGGASGAVFGLMGAAAVGLHRRGVNVFNTGLGTTLLLNLVLTFSISGVSIGGHLGGVAVGAALGWVMLAPGWRKPGMTVRTIAPLIAAAICVAASVAIALNTTIPIPGR